MRWRTLNRMGALALVPVMPALAAEGGDQSIFNSDIGNFLITTLTFVIVILVLGRFAWRPLLNVLQERERTIRESLESAKREREDAERLLAEYKAQLDKAREEASAIVDEGRRDAETVRQRIHDEARQESAEMIERARREIRLATDTAVKQLYDQTAELAVGLAGSILRKEISPEQHRSLVSESLEEMKKSGKTGLN